MSLVTMLAIRRVIQITIVISLASAIVIPGQLYEMIDYVVDFYMNDSCLVVISSGSYKAASYVSAIYVDPYEQQSDDQKTGLTSGENYKMGIIAPVLEIGCTGFLVQVENPGRQLRLIEETFSLVNQRIQRKFIFLPTTSSVTQNLIGAHDVFLDSNHFDFWTVLLEKSIHHIPDVVLAIPNNIKNHVELFTHRFNGPEKNSHQVMYLDTYAVAEKLFKYKANLFPDKIKDLEGKVLRVALFHYPPSVVIDSDNDINRIDGTEWRFAQEFAKLHNCSIKVIIDNEEAWGYIHENLTGKGMIGSIIEDRADLALTTLFTEYKRSRFFDLSSYHYRSGVTCLVPGPRQLPQWMSPIFPFTPVLWITFIGMTLGSAILNVIISRTESFIRSENSSRLSFNEAALTVCGITLLQGLRKDPEGPSLSILSITLLIVSLLMVTAYGSSLVSALTVPRYTKPIDTTLALAASGIPWAAAEQAWVVPILDAEEPEIQTLVKNFHELSPSELANHSAVGDHWAFPIVRIWGHYSIPDYLNVKSLWKMHLMKSDIYWAYCVSMLRKSSPFTMWYSRRVLEIQASGIPAYWQTDVVINYLDMFTQSAIETDDKSASDHPVGLTVQRLQGTFSILMIGLVLSGLVFLIELAHARRLR